MAQVIRGIVDAQAPGVFFGEGSQGVNYTQLIKEGPMQKLGRGRGLVSSILGKKWAARNFKLHEDKKVYYYDGTTPRGEFSIENGKFEKKSKEDADGHENAFEITTTKDEKITVCCETPEEMEEWLSKMKLVASGRWALYRFTDMIAQVAKIELTPPQKIDVEVDEEAFLAVMSADGYGADRMVEILQEYLKEIYGKIARFVAEDEEFSVLFKKLMFAYRIRVRKADDEDTSKGYYRTKFNADGELEIHYIKAWTNLGQLGDDLVYAVSVGQEVPYVVAKSIRIRTPALNSLLNSFEQLFGVSGVKYDYSVHENVKAMTGADYELTRFGEIVIQEHLTTLFQKMAHMVGSNMAFKPAFVKKWASKTIIIRPAANPDAQSTYYKASFTAEGSLLIEYKRFWCNINEIGADIPSLV